MNKNNYSLQLFAGIDTLEVTSPTYLGDVNFDFVTHDETRRIKKEGIDQLPKYKYRFNPDKTAIDTSTLDGYKIALAYMLECTAVNAPVKTRLDFRFDLYTGNYADVFKLNKLLLLLLAEKYDIKNRYQCIDMLTGELKTLCIKNQYIEAEAYNKAIQEPESGIACRLELRSKKLYDDEDEDGKELRELEKWYVRIADATTAVNYNKLIDGINKHLLERYSELKAKKAIATAAEFVTKYADFIFSTRQLVDLYKRMGFKNPNSAATQYKTKHRIECFSLNDLRNYAKTIRNSAAIFTEEAAAKITAIR